MDPANAQFLWNLATQPLNPYHMGKGIYNAAKFIGQQRPTLPAGKPKRPGTKKRAKRATNTSGKIRSDGVLSTGSLQKKTKKKRRVKKTTIASRVKALEKNAPQFSFKEFSYVIPVTQSTGTTNRRIMSESILLDRARIEGFINNLGGVDFTVDNSSVKLSNIYLEMFLVNQTTANVQLRYKWYMCKDDDNESVLDNMREGLIDRGLGFTNTVTTKVASSAVTAEVPRNLALDEAEMEFPMYSVREVDRKWTGLSGVTKAMLGPGDSVNIVKTLKQIVYRPEDHDNEPFTYMKGYNVHLVWDIVGALGHNTVTNTNLVVHTGYRMDGKMKAKLNVKFADERGLREKEITSEFTRLNANLPIHADNKQSALEQSLF